jgi:hypothetical protein
MWIQAAAGIAAVAWSAAAIVLVVLGRLSMAALAAISIGHLLLWPVAWWQNSLLSWSMLLPVVWGVVIVSLVAGWLLLLKAFGRPPSGA